MKQITIFIAILIVASLVSYAEAHEGMIALYADPSPESCQAILPELTMIDLSLFYIRGDGPVMANACEFRLLKSNDNILISSPEFDESLGLVWCIGFLESGISICYHLGEDWCFEEEYSFLGTIPVMNISDPDTFTVSVVGYPGGGGGTGLAINTCAQGFPLHLVIGGTFVFNGTCESPENPFQDPTPIQSSTWGAIKGLFK